MNSDLFFGVKKNKKEDKNQFLKSQKEAREQREQAKKEQKCALKIQSLYRSAKVREKIIRDLVADRFKKLGDVHKLKDKLPPVQFALIANKIFQYKDFLSFVVFLKPSNAKDYKELVLVLSDFLLSSLETEDALFLNILNRNRENRVAWYVKFKHILNSLLQIAFGTTTTGELDGMNDGSKEKTLAVQLLNKVMKINTNVWPTLGNALVKNKDLDLSLRKEIKQRLTNSISSRVIQNIIVSQEFKQSSFLRKFILKTAIDRHDISNEGMFMELMSLQSFYDELKAMNSEKRLKLVTFLVQQIEKEQFSIKDAKFSQRFIKELVEFLHFTITNHLLQGLNAKFFQNIFNILCTYIESYNSAMLSIIENKKIVENSMEVEEEKGSPTKSPGKQKTIEIRTVIAKNPSMALSLDSNGIKHFCEIISGVFAMFTSADFDTFSTLIAKGCETILLFKRSLKTNDKNLLKNILSFQLNFYYLPFMCIKRQGYNVKSMMFVPEKYIPIIKVFSQVLYQTLRITDDEEFLGNTEIVQQSWLLVTKEDLIEIASFTNHLLYNIIWGREVSYYPVISSEVKLVRELYNRDSRLKYCPKNFWIIPELEGMTQTLLSDPGHLKIEALRDIIDKVPHMLTFETRLKILYRMIEKDKEEYDRFPGFDPEYDIDDDDDQEPGQTKDPKVISIHRQFLLEDGFEKITKRRDMRSLFMIRFINEHGMPEEGIDGGGLLKEFITLIGKTAFDVNYGLFVENEDKTLMPNQNSYLNPEHLKLFNFLGRLTGKGIYEHILLESVFSVIFLNRLLKIPNTINELKFADPTLYKNLMLLKHRNDVADKLHLTFSVDETAMGNTRTHLLKANGDQIEVNEANKLEYLSLFCDYKLNQVIKDQSQAFLNGLKSAIDLPWIKMFNHEELQYVISGMRKKGFNVEDLKANVEYRGFDLHGPTITHFWEVLNEMSEDERSLFLLFVTGCSRPPTLGFKFMEPKIAIHNSSNDLNDIEKLPTASTCANLFKLPNYKDKELLRKKIMYAINANAGFDLG